MRPLWGVSDLFVCLILSVFNAVTSVIYVENGTSLILNPNIQGKPEDILWTYNGNKVAEHDLTEFQDYGLFKGRSEIEISTGQLTVRHMTSHDSGIYRSVIQINGKLQQSENKVQVIDAVQEPKVSCKLNSSSESRALFCSVSSQFHVSYEWTGSSSSGRSGQELLISSEEKPDSVYTCTVKNEVSQKSSNFSLKDCHTDEPLSYQDITLPVAVSVSGAAVIVGIVAGVAFCCLKKRKNTRDYGMPLNPLTENEPLWPQELIEVRAVYSSAAAEEDGGKGSVGSGEEDRINDDHKSDVNQALCSSDDAEEDSGDADHNSGKRTDSEDGEKTNEKQMTGAEHKNNHELLSLAQKRSESEKNDDMNEDGDMNDEEWETNEGN